MDESVRELFDQSTGVLDAALAVTLRSTKSYCAEGIRVRACVRACVYERYTDRETDKEFMRV